MKDTQISHTIKHIVSSMANPLRSPIMRTPSEYGLKYEDVFFPLMDGVTLEGWFIPAKSNKLIIANHPLWFSRAGFPGHLEPWGQPWAASGNNIEVNFMPDYKNLHDAGYNILCYDLRNFGHSGVGSGGVVGNGVLEYRDVIGSLRYAKERSDTKNMTVGLLSRCCGMNATMVAMKKHPEYFRDIRCIVAPQPISLRAFYETIASQIGASDRIEEFDTEVRKVTSIPLDEMTMTEYAKSVTVPTYLLQVRADSLTSPTDVQQMFDNMPTKDKYLHWVEGTTKRFEGYKVMPENPKPMLDWFGRFMN